MTRNEYNQIVVALEYLDRGIEIVESGRVPEGLSDIRSAAIFARVLAKIGKKKYSTKQTTD